MGNFWSVAAVIGVTYVACSYVLLKYPELLHRKKKLRFVAHHISHRGGAGENIENTMTAYKYAIGCGTGMLEVDCQLTADGVVVISHDDDLTRVTEAEEEEEEEDSTTLKISQTPYHRLPHISPVLPLQFDNSFTIRSRTGDPEQIPTLEEVFQAFPNTPVNIDIKVENQRLIELVNGLIVKYKREHLCIWGAFSERTSELCYKKNPNVALLMSFRQVAKLYAAFYLGLLPFLPVKESALEIMMPSILLKLDVECLDEKKGNPDTDTKHGIMMRPSLFKHLQKRGIHVYLWVLNHETDFDRARQLGVDGIMTDFPTKLREFYVQKPLRISPSQLTLIMNNNNNNNSKEETAVPADNEVQHHF